MMQSPLLSDRHVVRDRLPSLARMKNGESLSTRAIRNESCFYVIVTLTRWIDFELALS